MLQLRMKFAISLVKQLGGETKQFHLTIKISRESL